MYSIDLETIVQLLSEFRQSGTLSAELPQGLPGLKGRYLAWLELIEGNIVSCYIKDTAGGNILSGEEALRVLYNIGKLDWITGPSLTANPSPRGQEQQSARSPSVDTWQTASSPAMPVYPPAVSHPPIPRHVQQVSQQDLNQWPRKYRRIYSLVNGERDVSKIAAIISPSTHNYKEVLEVLRELRAMKLIALEE
ncbi:MAG: hypothetical protein H0W02_09200 [Ktedonobacteraceae bacterium]|nr:hypothetical protein [Ktedonobacteraceae bacterium]